MFALLLEILAWDSNLVARYRVKMLSIRGQSFVPPRANVSIRFPTPRSGVLLVMSCILVWKSCFEPKVGGVSPSRMNVVHA